MLDAVYGLNALQNILNGIVDGVFARLQRQPLVSHVLKRDNFAPDILLGQLFAGDVLVFVVIGTVGAAVDAVIGEVKRRKHHDAVAVKALLDLHGQFLDLLNQVRLFAFQQNRSLPMAEALAIVGALDQTLNQRPVGLILLGIFQGVQNFLMVDEFFGPGGIDVVGNHGVRSFFTMILNRGQGVR